MVSESIRYKRTMTRTFKLKLLEAIAAADGKFDADSWQVRRLWYDELVTYSGPYTVKINSRGLRELYAAQETGEIE